MSVQKKIYGVFDAAGVPQGYYADDIYLPKPDGSRNEAIPAAAVEITEADWNTLLAHNPFARYADGTVTILPTPPPPPIPAVRDANARLDAGVLAALDVAVAVKAAMQNIPDTFSNANFIATKIQLDALTEAMVAMLQGQADVSGKPPAIKPP
jgi:hypothetical protein